jgi:hypothetical protein
LPAPALHDSCAKLIKKTSRSARKVKNSQGLTAGCGGFGGGTLLDSVKREGLTLARFSFQRPA